MLWQYNLHYFDDMNARAAKSRATWHSDLVEDWILSNQSQKSVGWDPYPTSLRIVNWVKWAFADNTPSKNMVHSLAVQARWLEARLEWHLLGNHLFANAKALIFAGAFFEGTEADRWLARGISILMDQLPEQILRDGGQFELSPMYHALAIEDVLDLINLLNFMKPPQANDILTALNDHIGGMWRWLMAMSHPDKRISFFNDAAFNVAPENHELRQYAMRLNLRLPDIDGRIVNLEDSGYVRLTLGPAVVIADVAAVGPSYLPGHAHADTLSFELSLFAQRVFVNSGCSVYGTGAERRRQRGTAAHNTVVLNGQDSTEVWGGFRVARRARIIDCSTYYDDGTLIVRASHDGYRRLPGAPVHSRKWTLTEHRLTILDEISPFGDHGEARFHLHPKARIELTGACDGRIYLPEQQVIMWKSTAPARLENTTWHPEFGASVPNNCLVFPTKVGKSTFELSWN
ncbi:Heparin-sulfate lyase (plasmid) [Sulfitobacter indolifex]|uniref:heparinase II/III family protein n=1 Tax=Sulfitobacter indolifex TaxID=225422 RepID=UPI001FAC2D39|nr:heparinase II/III family protein [Sulfitobacter indolifex]UOA20685.1 Heparin-sulfate lyase [Sulfitobacter indolifex]